MRRLVAALGFVVTLSGCSPFAGYRTCSEPPAARQALAPLRLSETGLYRDIGRRVTAPGVLAYRPRFELWSDGAAKSRFLALPAGAVISTADMDAWQFPKGTKLWKELAREGRPVETRLMEKTGNGQDDWLMMAYVWNADGSDAVASPGGDDRLGVPAARDCRGCHGGTKGRVLGVSAVQLAGQPVLDRLAFTTSPPRALPIPGDATTQATLGYLHANCAHCHNQHRPARTGARCFDPEQSFDLSLRVSEMGSVETTAVYRTAIGRIITRGQPDDSDLVSRFEGRVPFAPRMPALGTKETNRDAAQLLRAWIGAL